MLIVNTTYQVAEASEASWKSWVKTVYIPAVTKSAQLINPRLFRLLVEEEPGIKHYALQFEVANDTTLEAWFESDGKALQHSMGAEFSDQVLGFTTIMENQPI
jgi:Domain of unknown function (DUF4286)